MPARRQAIETIGFDADDTLWQNEQFYQSTQQQFAALLADHTDEVTLRARLEAAERRNLGRYGFGVKGFILSMIETALEVTGDQLPGPVLRQLIAAGHEMLAQPVELLPGVTEVLTDLAQSHRLVLVTKGDLLDQERKLAGSGLGDLFCAVEIVSDKTAATYRTIFDRYGPGPESSVMVGNSLRSDVLPALEAGAHAVWVPHPLTWSYEAADPPGDGPRFHQIGDLTGLRALLHRLG